MNDIFDHFIESISACNNRGHFRSTARVLRQDQTVVLAQSGQTRWSAPKTPSIYPLHKTANTTVSEANRGYYLASIFVQPVWLHGTSTSLAGVGQAGPSNA
jgi:hypothetical protein